MTKNQLKVFYAITLTFWAVVVLGASHYLDGRPMTSMQYADKLCQEAYGPQTAAAWSGEKLVCETVRGEIVSIKREHVVKD
jgi:hypothetical protein